ncbi:MAG: ABC exporter membrane fusion protein [Coleofasciculaceae cyanobacterium]
MMQKESQALAQGSQPFIKTSRSLAKPVGQWIAGLTVAVGLAAGASVIYYNFVQEQGSSESATVTAQAEAAPIITSVAALGRLEPEGEIIRLSAPLSIDGTRTRISELLVKQGDQVKKDQVVAILYSRDTSQATLEKAKSNVQVAQANLARIKAGARQGEIQAQREAIVDLEAELRGQISSQEATISRIKAELGNAKVEYGRYEQLHKEGGISTSELDSRRLRLDTAEDQLEEAKAALGRTVETLQVKQRQAKATLAGISEVRPVDVQVAQAEVATALAQVKEAQSQLDLTYIKSPLEGKVLELHVRPGEVISEMGIAEIGQTGQMYAVAEVYQTDIGKVKLGQEAIVSSPVFPDKLRGEVAEIGLRVDRQNVFNVNPMANTDNKVVDVKIRLNPEDSKKVENLTNLQVDVQIKI